jgi:DNA-binding XRE family transcriptional regulator
MPQVTVPGEGLNSMNERHTGGRGRGRPQLRSVPDLGPGDQLRIHLGERLRAVRQESRLTQEKAAAAAGLTRNAIADLEKTRFPNPKLSTLLRLMRAYELRSLEELLGPVPNARLAAAWEEEGWETAREGNSQQ